MTVDPAGRYVCGLDVGTTKVCAVVGRLDISGEMAVVGMSVVPSAGLKRGIVVDRDEAVATIRRCLDEVRQRSGIRIEQVYLGYTGEHISSTNVRGRTFVAGPEVTPEDVQEAIAAAREAVPLAADRCIIQTIVRSFSLDGEHGIRRPVGLVGRQLDVELHAVTGRESVIENLVGCVRAAGVEVAAQVLEPLATAQATLSNAEREIGCVLVDIGGGTTDMAVFAGGAILHSSAVAIAGNHVTMDLAKLLRISPEDAEQLKLTHGHALADEVPEDEFVEVHLVGTGEPQRVPRRLVAEIIQARMEEIFEAVGARLEREKLWAHVPGGVVVSGGGAQLPGTARLATTVLRGLPARVGAPVVTTEGIDAASDPRFATAIGLALLAAEAEAWCTEAQRKNGPPRRPWIGKLVELWNRVMATLHQWRAQH